MKLSISGSRSVAAAGLALAMALTNTLAQAQEKQEEMRAYRVSVTNIMGANQFTPILAVTHSRAASLFNLGEASSEPLATLAEGGDTGPLQSLLQNDSQVGFAETFATPGDVPLILAGDTLEFLVITPASFNRLSIAAMILPTNDSFGAVDSVLLPSQINATRTYKALGYDAGSEVNDELCANIPGPTCGGDGAFSGFNGEGFVHISRGVQGIGDLDSAKYDWRNPVAEVSVTRLK